MSDAPAPGRVCCGSWPTPARDGVVNVLGARSRGIDSGLHGVGKASIHDLTPDDIVVAPGFTRSLGVSTDRNS